LDLLISDLVLALSDTKRTGAEVRRCGKSTDLVAPAGACPEAAEWVPVLFLTLHSRDSGFRVAQKSDYCDILAKLSLLFGVFHAK
jgi:hypothetical protein